MTVDTRNAIEAMADFERRGDEALSAGDRDAARALYEKAQRCYSRVIDWCKPISEQVDGATFAGILNAVKRIQTKVATVGEASESPTPTTADPVAKLRIATDAAMESGDLAHASHLSFQLGDLLEESGDRGGAETAFRQAVALARQVDADPELVLAAFAALVFFLAPSEESNALAAEMADQLLHRDEMYHPMRAAEAALVWARAELEYAEVVPDRLDQVLDGVVRQALEMLDAVCLHEIAQELRHEVAEALRTTDRRAEADEWRTEADKYGVWERFSDQQIPGHVHLWDIR